MRAGDPESIQRVFKSFGQETDMIVETIIELVYFMRGAISYEEMMWRTPGERQRISQFIQKRLESQKGSMSPVF